MTAKLRWVVPLVLFCGAVAVLLVQTPEDGAQYAGRDLTEWVREAEISRRKSGKPSPKAQEAILIILTNHCEAVLRRNHEPTMIDKQKSHLRASLPGSVAGSQVARWLLGGSAKAERSFWANVAFGFSRPAVKTVVAELEQFSSPTNSLSLAAVKGLGSVGTPEAEDALVRLATNPAHPYRVEAILCLVAFGYSSEQVQRTVAALVSDPDPKVREMAESAVAYYKSHAANSVR